MLNSVKSEVFLCTAEVVFVPARLLFNAIEDGLAATWRKQSAVVSEDSCEGK